MKRRNKPAPCRIRQGDFLQKRFIFFDEGVFPVVKCSRHTLSARIFRRFSLYVVVKWGDSLYDRSERRVRHEPTENR